MKLKTYQNLYAYYIHTPLIRGREVSLQYSRASKSYSVVTIRDYSAQNIKHFTNCYEAKQYFKTLVKTMENDTFFA